MASNQVSREKKREQGVEKDKVPKITCHFESLTVSPIKESGVEKFEKHGVEEKDLSQHRSEMEGVADVTKYRQEVHHKSNDALRSAAMERERYNKAKQGQDALMQGGQVAADKAARAKESVMQGAQRTSQYAAEKGAVLKDTAIEKGQPLFETTRDTLSSAGKTAAEKAVGAKDVVAETGKGTAGYVVKAKDYVADKAVGAKDVVVESGKGTVGYVGSVASSVKDKAVVAGWGAAEYTAEKVVGATKAVANVTAGAAGYVGDTAVAAKDTVGNVGVSAKDYAAQKLGAAKDAVVATEESAKEYAARKRAEAQRELQAKKSAEARGEVWTTTEQKHDDIAGAGRQTVDKVFQEQSEYGTEGGGGGGVFNAIGETIVEIGQTTKDFLVGKGQQTTPATETVKDSSEYNK